MILPDVNTLVHAFHRDSAAHDRYATADSGFSRFDGLSHFDPARPA